MMYYTGWLSVISALIALYGLFGITAMLWCVKDDIIAGIKSIVNIKTAVAAVNIKSVVAVKLSTKKRLSVGTVIIGLLLIFSVMIALLVGHKF